MTAILKKISLAGLSAAMLLGGCTKFDEPHNTGSGNAPDGYFTFAPRFKAENSRAIVSRALDDPDLIDDVYMFIFSDTNLSGDIDDNDELEFREYYEYGKTQDIYLKMVRDDRNGYRQHA